MHLLLFICLRQGKRLFLLAKCTPFIPFYVAARCTSALLGVAQGRDTGLWCHSNSGDQCLPLISYYFPHSPHPPSISSKELQSDKDRCIWLVGCLTVAVLIFIWGHFKPFQPFLMNFCEFVFAIFIFTFRTALIYIRKTLKLVTKFGTYFFHL